MSLNLSTREQERSPQRLSAALLLAVAVATQAGCGGGTSSRPSGDVTPTLAPIEQATPAPIEQATPTPAPPAMATPTGTLMTVVDKNLAQIALGREPVTAKRFPAEQSRVSASGAIGVITYDWNSTHYVLSLMGPNGNNKAVIVQGTYPIQTQTYISSGPVPAKGVVKNNTRFAINADASRVAVATIYSTVVFDQDGKALAEFAGLQPEDFAPDGRLVLSENAFADRYGVKRGLYVADASLAKPVPLSLSIPRDGSELDPAEARVSPGGTTLAFSSHGTVYAVPVAGGMAVVVKSRTVGSDYSPAAWSPDGRWLAVKKGGSSGSLGSVNFLPVRSDGTYDDTRPQSTLQYSPTGTQVYGYVSWLR